MTYKGNFPSSFIVPWLYFALQWIILLCHVYQCIKTFSFNFW